MVSKAASKAQILVAEANLARLSSAQHLKRLFWLVDLPGFIRVIVRRIQSFRIVLDPKSMGFGRRAN